MAHEHRVIFPQYARGRNGVSIEEGATLWDHAWRLGIQVASACGGRGQCGKCVVRVESGGESLAERTEAERRFPLARDERLACQARIISSARDVVVYIWAAGEYTILTESTDQGMIRLDPHVSREGDRVVLREERIHSLGAYEGELLGLAVDVGTTTLVAQIVDLESGEVVATLACRNPQAAYGDDVISRIGYADTHEDGLRRLQRVVVEAVNSALRTFEGREGRSTVDHIYEAVVVGNPTMRNLFFGLSVHSLGTSPYEPQDISPINLDADAVGLEINPRANVYGAPLVAGQVGADCLAVILASGLHRVERPVMVVDIGTNGEVAIGSRERILAASNAAGGAFEGATVSCGTGAIEGAIKNVSILNGAVRYETIGDKPAVGICGSGLIDLLAEMLKNGIIDRSGRLAQAYRAANEFVISQNGRRIGITQKDINELRLAKAGSALNQQTLMRKYGVDLEGVDRIYLAGGFGNYVSLDSAMAIGVLPARKEKLVKIGNGALTGARQMLLSRERRADAERIAPRIGHVKLSEEADFLDRYVRELYLRPWP
ncbi:MAG: DUF4445 domain-containing protein [Anaerolineae bacterium]|nr:DUF4445 domain-containing protein [Anaerolineae bacterium]